VQLMEVDKY